MKRFIACTVLGLALASSSFAVRISGIVTGADCGLEGMTCELNHLLTGHELLGIFNERTKKFYFLTNVPQKILVYLFGKEVNVEGKKLAPNAVKVKILKHGGKVFYRSR